MRAKSTRTKRTKEAHKQKGTTMIGEIVENRRRMSYNCTQKSCCCCYCCGQRPCQKRIYFCTFCALFCVLAADFHAKESLTFSRKIRPVVTSSSSCSCCSRAIEARKTKREPPPRARARSLRNGIIRKDVQFGTTTTTSPTTTFSLCVAEDVDDDVVFYRHQQEE